MLSSNYREPTPAQRAALLEESKHAPAGSGLAAVYAAVHSYIPGRAPGEPSPAERRSAAEADNDRSNTMFVPNGRVGRLVGANELQQRDAAAKKTSEVWSEAIAKINAQRDSPIRDFS
jgi:hypothetical protein